MTRFSLNAKHAAMILVASSFFLASSCGKAEKSEQEIAHEGHAQAATSEVGPNIDGCAVGTEASINGLSLTKGWLRAMPATARTTGGYLTIENKSGAEDTLVSVTTGAAEITEIHQSYKDEDGEMMMRRIPDGLVVPNDETVALEPGSYHLMLINPTGALENCDSVDVTFSFEKAGDITMKLTAKGVKESMDHSGQ